MSTSFDGKAFGVEIVSVVKDYLERTLSPLAARIEQLEARIVLLEAQAGTAKAKPTIRITAPSRRAE
ncbi:hypothetical protein [Rhizobium ruizarguesonis]|uniref:hypothetical protein n=1 Tax=Rhizobium ruizarguesonis TaxID=2081791 RepID=UPI0037106D0B